MPKVSARKLLPVVERTLRQADASDASATHVAACTVETSLRGVDSHGINLLPHYHRAVRLGRVNGDPQFRFEQTGASTSVLDADNAFGHHAGTAAMDHAVALAATTGLAAVAVRNSSHFGAAAYYALPAARRGYIALSFTNADALVRAAGAKEAFFGTNPICFAAPLDGEDPLCLDMATSRVSWNKILDHRRRGETLPAGWAHDSHGEPTTDPAAARMLNAIGDYKGFGLGLVVECLCGLLADGPVARELLPMYSAPMSTHRRISHFFMALSIERFVPKERFTARLGEMVAQLRAMSTPESPVMVPSDPEKTAQKERSVAGIPVAEEKWAEFLEISADYAETVVE